MHQAKGSQKKTSIENAAKLHFFRFSTLQYLRLTHTENSRFHDEHSVKSVTFIHSNDEYDLPVNYEYAFSFI